MSSNVDIILNKVKSLAEGLDLMPQEKQELLQKLTDFLQGSSASMPTSASGQHMSNTLGNVQFGTGQAVLDYKPIQNQGGTVNASDNIAQTYTPTPDMRKVLEELDALTQRIAQSNENPLLKDSAQEKVATLVTELAKPQPDKNLVQKTVHTLKQGLEGVQTLAAPTLAVAKLIANVWGIPV